MLRGFDHITAELTPDEMRLVPLLIKGFRNHVGPRNAITSRQIVEAMAKRGKKITDVHVRKFASYIRVNRMLPGLVASSAGYYVTTDQVELKRHIDSLAGRENAIRAARLALTEDLKYLTHRRIVSLPFPEALR